MESFIFGALGSWSAARAGIAVRTELFEDEQQGSRIARDKSRASGDAANRPREQAAARSRKCGWHAPRAGVKRLFAEPSRDTGIWRFSAGILQIALFLIVLGWLYRLLFAWLHRASLETASAETLLTMLLRGLQFDLAVVAFALVPALLLYHLLAACWPSPCRHRVVADPSTCLLCPCG
jgi:hypothetical protein